jgi:hypothetical protein
LDSGKIINARRKLKSKKDGIKDTMFQKVGTNKKGQVEKRKKQTNRIAAIDDITWQGSRERSWTG